MRTVIVMPVSIVVSIVVTLAVVDLRRWIPWLAERIVSAAARNFDKPNRQIKDEEYRANLRYAEGPLSMLALAVYTFIKSPFRARELRGHIRASETPIAAQAAQLASIAIVRLNSDNERSAAEYDAWYLARSSAIFAQEREMGIADATNALHATSDFRRFDPNLLIVWPKALTIARACACPPMSNKRFLSASGTNPRLVSRLEGGVALDDTPTVRTELQTMCDFLSPQFDRRLLCWLDHDRTPTEEEREQALLAIGERLAKSTHEGRMIRAIFTRQRQSLRAYLESNGFTESAEPMFEMPAGTFSFKRKIDTDSNGWRQKRTVDCVLAPLDQQLPLVIVESLSASELSNSGYLRDRLRSTASMERSFSGKIVLMHHFFGHFRTASLDAKWVWDHRLSDLGPFLGIGG
jgi:hypothetical protein